jgi:protein N-terminal methyltransferase
MATPSPADSHINPTESLAYWTSTPSTVSGMLGGFPQVSRIDISGSHTFLTRLLRHSKPTSRPKVPYKLHLAADTGAGIGRVTRNLLSPLAEHIDVVEPVPKFTDQLQRDAPELFTPQDTPKVQRIINVGLEDWMPAEGRKYDLVWNQWCLGHLPDAALVAYLQRVAAALNEGGWIVVKENVIGAPSKRRFAAHVPRAAKRSAGDMDSGGQQQAGGGDAADGDGETQHEGEAEEQDEYDEVDSSVTRSGAKFERCFRDAGLKVVKTELQRGFGKDLGLFPVRMWGLQPVGAPMGQ